MHVVVTSFRVERGAEGAFERWAGPGGPWARAKECADGFLGTELLRASDGGGAYAVVDHWSSPAACEASRVGGHVRGEGATGELRGKVAGDPERRTYLSLGTTRARLP